MCFRRGGLLICQCANWLEFGSSQAKIGDIRRSFSVGGFCVWFIVFFLIQPLQGCGLWWLRFLLVKFDPFRVGTNRFSFYFCDLCKARSLMEKSFEFL